MRRIFALALSGMSCGISPPPPTRRECLLRNLRESPSGKTRPLHRPVEQRADLRHAPKRAYIGNMVQGRSVKISYKSKKCLKQSPANWVWWRVPTSHWWMRRPFQKVRMLVNSRRHTRSRTYDFLLKGLIFCHECGYPLAVLNRKNARGEDVLYFVCRTYQRFTKRASAPATPSGENGDRCSDRQGAGGVPGVSEPRRAAARGPGSVENVRRQSSLEAELRPSNPRSKASPPTWIGCTLTGSAGCCPRRTSSASLAGSNWSGSSWRKKRQELKLRQKSPVRSEDRARELVQRFIETAGESRELLVSLIEAVELTEDKEIIIKFRFAQLDERRKARHRKGLRRLRRLNFGNISLAVVGALCIPH